MRPLRPVQQPRSLLRFVMGCLPKPARRSRATWTPGGLVDRLDTAPRRGAKQVRYLLGWGTSQWTLGLAPT